MDYEKYLTIHSTAYKVFESLPVGTIFSAGEFKQKVVELCPSASASHIASVVRPLWDYRMEDDKKASFICINRAKSLYKKISLEEWNEAEKKIKQEKKSKQIAKAVILLRENGFQVEKIKRS